MKQIRKWLIVTGRGDMRIVSRQPRLNFDEVAFPIRVTLPDTWGRLYTDIPIDVTMPEAPAPTIQVEGSEAPVA